MTISLMTSTDGQSWTGRDVPGEGWTLVTRGASKWVIAGIGDAGVKIATSNDGITWADRGEVGGDLPYDMAYGNGRFVIATPGAYLVSTDGITWDTVSSDVGDRLAYGAGTFVSLGYSTDLSAVAYRLSGNGLTWAAPVAPSEIQNGWTSFKFINNTFVAVGDDASNLYVANSSDGETWASHFVVNTPNQSYVAYHSGYVLVTGIGTSFTSPNLVTWTLAGPLGQPENTLWSGLDFAAGNFVAISDHGHVMTSTNAASWAAVTSALADHRLEDIAIS